MADGTEGAGDGRVELWVSGAWSDQTVTYHVTRTGGTATFGTDYTQDPSGSTIIANVPAYTIGVIDVLVIDDQIYEGTETVQYRLDWATVDGYAAQVWEPNATVNVYDDDQQVSMGVQDSFAKEGVYPGGR